MVVQEPEVRFEELDNAINRAAAPHPPADDPNEGRFEALGHPLSEQGHL